MSIKNKKKHRSGGASRRRTRPRTSTHPAHLRDEDDCPSIQVRPLLGVGHSMKGNAVPHAVPHGLLSSRAPAMEHRALLSEPSPPKPTFKASSHVQHRDEIESILLLSVLTWHRDSIKSAPYVHYCQRRLLSSQAFGGQLSPMPNASWVFAGFAIDVSPWITSDFKPTEMNTTCDNATA